MTKTRVIVLVVVGVAVAGGLIALDALGRQTAAQWSASAAWVTTFLAFTAGVIGFQQLRDARELRQQQAQPYVAVSMEPLWEVDPKFSSLVVKNFGATAAFNVRIDSVPTMKRSKPEEMQDVRLPMLPTLVPGQDWRTLWDFYPWRHQQDLPDEHKVTVTFEDQSGRQFRYEYMLDWDINFDRLSVTAHTVHDGVKELQNISKKLDGVKALQAISKTLDGLRPPSGPEDREGLSSP